MKKICSFALGLVVLGSVNAQVKNPVQWSFSAKKINPSSYELHLTAKIEDGWHIYSQTTPEGGPVPTSISFTRNPLIAINGVIKEIGKLEENFEELFGVNVKQFSNKVDFVQTITVKPGIRTSMNGYIEFMTCNDHECMPPAKQSFAIVLN